MLLDLAADKPEAKLVWTGTGRNEKKTQQLHAIMATPFLEDDTIYGVCSYGQLRALDLKTGERLWESLDATGADPRDIPGSGEFRDPHYVCTARPRACWVCAIRN